MESECLWILLNLGSEPRHVPAPRGGQIVLSTYLDRRGENVEDFLTLRPAEGVVVRTTPASR